MCLTSRLCAGREKKLAHTQSQSLLFDYISAIEMSFHSWKRCDSISHNMLNEMSSSGANSTHRANGNLNSSTKKSLKYSQVKHRRDFTAFYIPLLLLPVCMEKTEKEKRGKTTHIASVMERRVSFWIWIELKSENFSAFSVWWLHYLISHICVLCGSFKRWRNRDGIFFCFAFATPHSIEHIFILFYMREITFACVWGEIKEEGRKKSTKRKKQHEGKSRIIVILWVCLLFGD